MPVYRSYLPAPTAELVALNAPQQIVHERTATPILINNANVHQMIVQGQKALLNGQEVIITPQPQPMQHIVQVPANQPEVALSTYSQPPAYAPVAVSAPPSYNPDYDEAAPAEPEHVGSYQNEGGDTGVAAPAETRRYYHE